MSAEPLKTAVFGAGRAGSIHISNLLTLPGYFALAFIVDDYPGNMEKTLEKLPPSVRPEVVGTGETSEVIRRVDAVIIAAPTKTHEGLVREALTEGKQVFCEKPLSYEIPVLAELYDLAQSKGVQLLCGMNRRFDPSVAHLTGAVRAGHAGQVLKAKMTSRDSPYPPVAYIATCPNIISDCGIHDIDLLMFMLQEVPSQVYCMGNCFNPEVAALGDDDNVLCVLNFPSGALGCIDMNRECSYGYDQRIEVHGRTETLFMSNQPQHSVTTGSRAGLRDPRIKESFTDRFAESYKRELLHFYRAATGWEELCITRDQVLNATLVTDALTLSRKINRPVNIDAASRTFAPAQ